MGDQFVGHPSAKYAWSCRGKILKGQDTSEVIDRGAQ